MKENIIDTFIQVYKKMKRGIDNGKRDYKNKDF